jgi:hypothetical protein
MEGNLEGIVQITEPVLKEIMDALRKTPVETLFCRDTGSRLGYLLGYSDGDR